MPAVISLSEFNRNQAEVIERLSAGEIGANPRNGESCRYCPVLRCERRMM